MAEPIRRGRALWQIVGSRIVALRGALAVVIQVAVVLDDYWSDDLQLADLMVEQESDGLAQGVSLDPDGGVRFVVPPGLARYGKDSRTYFTRVRTPGGLVLYSNCRDDCSAHLLPQEVNPPDFWSRLLRPGKPIAVAGGRSLSVRGTKVFVEVAILDDHERVMRPRPAAGADGSSGDAHVADARLRARRHADLRAPRAEARRTGGARRPRGSTRSTPPTPSTWPACRRRSGTSAPP